MPKFADGVKWRNLSSGGFGKRGVVGESVCRVNRTRLRCSRVDRVHGR